jgi:predicted DsbA family dithiol-disulfide isomerase
MDPTPGLPVRLHYDLASSLCYVAHRVVKRLAPDLEELGIEIVWSPLDLALLLGWRRGGLVPAERRATIERVSCELRVNLWVPPEWLDSRRAMAVALHLDGSPREETWRERIWTAVFEEGRDIGSEGEIERLARELDLELPPGSMERGLETLEARTWAASQEMVSGVPTFMLGRWPFGGIQNDDTMRSILKRYARKQHREAREDLSQ